MLRGVVWYKLTDVSEVPTASIISLMMEAISSSETSVNFYQITLRNIPGDSHLSAKNNTFYYGYNKAAAKQNSCLAGNIALSFLLCC
jgi:hypothetical protein